VSRTRLCIGLRFVVLAAVVGLSVGVAEGGVEVESDRGAAAAASVAAVPSGEIDVIFVS
jgi:hypothetical protein